MSAKSPVEVQRHSDVLTAVTAAYSRHHAAFTAACTPVATAPSAVSASPTAALILKPHSTVIILLDFLVLHEGLANPLLNCASHLCNIQHGTIFLI